LWVELSEDVELGVERVGGIKIIPVLTRPTEGSATRHTLQVVGVDSPLTKDCVVLVGKIVTNHRDHRDIGEEGGRD
jgi:hypothetical protein